MRMHDKPANIVKRDATALNLASMNGQKAAMHSKIKPVALDINDAFHAGRLTPLAASKYIVVTLELIRHLYYRTRRILTRQSALSVLRARIRDLADFVNANLADFCCLHGTGRLGEILE